MSQYLQCCYPFIGACHLEIHISIVIFNSLPAQTKPSWSHFIPLYQKYRANTFETSKFSSALFCYSGLTLLLSLEVKSFCGQVSDPQLIFVLSVAAHFPPHPLFQVLILHPTYRVFQ